MRKFLYLILFSCSLSSSLLGQTYIGTHSFGGTGIDFAQGICIDVFGNQYVVGNYVGTQNFGGTSIGFAGGNADGYLAKYDAAGNPVWIKQFGNNQDEVALAVTTDPSGNIYVTGYFQGINFDADPGPGISLLSQPGPFLSRDCFIVKLDSNGDFIWAKQISNNAGAAQEDAYAILADANGNVYVGGRFQYADFDPGPAVFEILAFGGGSFDAFVVKLDSNGDFQYVRQFGGADNDAIRAMTFDSNGDILLGGDFELVADLDPTTGVNNFTSAGDSDNFIIKMDPAGSVIWANVIGGNGFETVTSIKTTANNGVLCSGVYSGTVDFDPGAGVVNSSPTGSWDGFLLALTSTGQYDWHFEIGGAGLDEITDVIPMADGSIIASGEFTGFATITINGSTQSFASNGNTDIFVLQMASNGQVLYGHSLGGTDTEASPRMVVNSVGEISMTGSFKNSADFDFTFGTDTYFSSGNYDVFNTRFSFGAVTPPIAVTTNNITDATCFEDTDGVIDISVAGGTPPYTYEWSDFQTIEDPINLGAGDYFVTITDVGGSTFVAGPLTVGSNPELVPTLDSLVNPLCPGENGAIYISTVGGTAPYSVLWSDGQTTFDVIVPPGMYDCTITDAIGCTIETTNPFLVDEIQDVVIDLDSSIAVSCAGVSDGGLYISLTGGTPPFTQLWNNGFTTEDLIDIPGGAYTITLTDDNGCLYPSSIGIPVSEPMPIVLSGVTTNDTLPAAETGAIDLTVIGGNGGFVFAWSNGAASEDLSGLAGGNYTVTVTDVNGCSDTMSFFIEAWIVGVSSPSLAEQVLVSPNPTTGVIFLDFKKVSTTISGIEVMDINGRKLEEVKTEFLGSHTAKIDLTNYPDGIYMIAISSDQSMEVLKIVKQ